MTKLTFISNIQDNPFKTVPEYKTYAITKQILEKMKQTE
jgi:hypothetical protein